MRGAFDYVYYNTPSWAQSFLVSVYGCDLYRKRYIGIYKKIKQEILEFKEASKDKIDAMQQERLHALIQYCYRNIPYYQNIFSEYALKPQDITSVADLQKLPILDKQVLREHISLFRPINGKRPFIVQKTSGSTGTPLALDVNEYTYKLAMALLVDHEESHGVPFRSRRATFAGRMIQPLNNLTPPFSRFNWAENQKIFSSYHLSSRTFPYYRKELDNFKPLEIIGYPSAISELATHYLEKGIRPQFQAKAIVTNSESLLSWQRDRIESAFQCPIYDYYGTAEYVIFAGQNISGIYKTNPLIGISEIVKESDDAQEGRIIATTLNNYAMPLVRYDVGDTAISIDDKGNSEGVKSIVRFNGRKDDYIFTPDGRKIGRIDHIFKGVYGIREAQVIQNSVTQCTILISTSKKIPNNEKLITENFKSRISEEIAINFEYVERIPRGKNGKFKSVVGIS
ncbi:phenylacetate--CoA ligase family protein [Mangrovitalea sediminis]|uniref:phenylacetate--CoA ligase family protein n=1 Tax=Mangrovitalea sediminis TaxID=1982043 RepID=UPI000BE627D1|nr:phenylacetate--CoA ligase family protein [Mangrovitalea sediminis]